MTETSTPTQDLAALARVTELLYSHGPVEDGTLRELNALREEIEEAYQRHCDLAEAFNAVRPAFVDETLPALGLAIIRAAVAVGAQIAFPSRDSAETPERSAADDTAPGIDTTSTVHRVCRKNPGCARPDGHDSGCAFLTVFAEFSAREKILAEVAASEAADSVPDFARVHEIVTRAIASARSPELNAAEIEVYSRTNLIRAAALLVLAVERMDDADE